MLSTLDPKDNLREPIIPDTQSMPVMVLPPVLTHKSLGACSGPCHLTEAPQPLGSWLEDAYLQNLP